MPMTDVYMRSQYMEYVIVCPTMCACGYLDLIVLESYRLVDAPSNVTHEYNNSNYGTMSQVREIQLQIPVTHATNEPL